MTGYQLQSVLIAVAICACVAAVAEAQLELAQLDAELSTIEETQP